MTIKLMPCPFCGGSAAMQTERAAEDAEAAYVKCQRCNVITDIFEDAYAPVEDAAHAWNTRSRQQNGLDQPSPGTTITGETVRGERSDLPPLTNDQNCMADVAIVEAGAKAIWDARRAREGGSITWEQANAGKDEFPNTYIVVENIRQEAADCLASALCTVIETPPPPRHQMVGSEKELSSAHYRAVHDAATAAYEAATPVDFRYSAIALRNAVDAAFAARAALSAPEAEARGDDPQTITVGGIAEEPILFPEIGAQEDEA